MIVWIVAFALIVATVYTLLNLPDYFLQMWWQSRRSVVAEREQLKAEREEFGRLNALASSYPPHPDFSQDIATVTDRVRSGANPLIGRIQAIGESPVWNLAVLENTTWSLNTPEFWKNWVGILRLQQESRRVRSDVQEVNRNVRILEALVARLQQADARSLDVNVEENPPADPELLYAEESEESAEEIELTLDEPLIVEENESPTITFQPPVRESLDVSDEPSFLEALEPDPPVDEDDPRELLPAFQLSLRQESVSSLLSLITAERVEGMKVEKLLDRAHGLQSQLDNLQNSVWGADEVSNDTFYDWMRELDGWREEKQLIGREVEGIQRKRVQHERDVRWVESKLDAWVSSKEATTLTKFADQVLVVGDEQLETLDWEGAADAVEIAKMIVKGLPNMDAIDKNGLAIQKRISQASGESRTVLARAASAYVAWRKLLTQDVIATQGRTRWLAKVRDDVTQAMNQKPEIIQLLNEATAAWNEANTQKAKLTDEANQWKSIIERDVVTFGRIRTELLETVSEWSCFQHQMDDIQQSMSDYELVLADPADQLLLEGRAQLNQMRQDALEALNGQIGRLRGDHAELHSTALDIHDRLRELAESIDETDYRAIAIQLQKAQRARDVDIAREALGSAQVDLRRLS